jgi:hypothetical protein
MSLRVLGRSISRVKVVDDDPVARKAMSFTVTDANLQALPDDGPLPELPRFVQETRGSVDAVVCDHRMKGTYATFDGAEAVANLYKAACPALLCTRWSRADIDSIRRFIPFIPSLISSDDINPDTIADGIAICIREFDNDPIPSRKPWRSLIRVESVEPEDRPPLFYVAIPGWDSKEILRLPLDLIPEKQRPMIKPGLRFYAKVNKGTETPDRLFLSDFEFPARG